MIAVVLGIGSALIPLASRPQEVAKTPNKPKKGPAVRVEPVQRASISSTLELTGEVVAINSVVISAMAEGPIQFCPWREGDPVRHGEKLVEIGRQTYRAETQAAEAALAVAKAKLEDMKAGTRPEEVVEAEQHVREWEGLDARAEAESERDERLLKPGGISQEDYEKSQADFKVAQANLAAARAHLEMLEAGSTRTAIAVQEAVVEEAAAVLEVAKARLAECLVVAPFDGTISAVNVRAGDIAAAKTPLLEMIDLSSLVIRFAVPEAYATVVRPEMPLTVTLDAYPSTSYRAAVVRVYPMLDSPMRTRTVEATLVDPVEVVPGMFARLNLQLKSVDNAIVVPQEAILVTPKGQKLLFVVFEGKAVQRKIATGIEQDRTVQVVEGVQPGEQVVVAGNEKLKDGMPVVLPGSGRGGPGSTGKLGSGGEKSAGPGGRQP